MFPPVRRMRSGGFGEAQAMPSPVPDQEVLGAVNAQIQDRLMRINYLLEKGESFWLPVSLGLPSPAASAGANYTVTSNNQDFDILIVGALANLSLSSVEIVDSARNRALTNGAVLIPTLAQVVKGTSVITFPFDWKKPYFLPAKAQLRITTTADGTETGGYLNFRCLMPPVYQG